MKLFQARYVAIIPLIILIAVVSSVKYAQSRAAAKGFENARPPAASVNAFLAQQQKWGRSISAIGTIRASDGITIVAERAGKVQRIAFNSGDSVKAGDILIEQESGNETAALASAASELKLAQANLLRITQLHDQNAVSDSEFENYRQQLTTRRANVSDLETTLEKKRIRAPFAGRLGIREVDLGEDLQVGGAVVSLQSEGLVQVNFPFSQKWISTIKANLAVEIHALEGDGLIAEGIINAVGAEVDPVTRNILAQATLLASEHTLLPGMAVEVKIILPEENPVLVVPATSVVYNSFGDSIFIIDTDSKTGAKTARQQFIQVSERRGDFVAIRTGLSEGEAVASAGAFKLYNGQSIEVSNSKETAYSTHPKPDES
ncbi:MAG: membrane fusion protein (multidrug efflux system) [Flavobacteriales bacterium]|jgi:membrane fusion protein (multidrug efflux system)